MEILAVMKRLEQLESTHGVTEMYEFLVHYETVLNDWRKSRIKIIKEQINFKSQTSFKYCCFFYHVFFFPPSNSCSFHFNQC